MPQTHLAATMLLAFASLSLSCSSSTSSCQEAPYVDPAPHQSAFVTLPDGNRLHYLDFGGSGEPLLFLAGAGDSAHVFDDFAPRFADRFRVLALTRRGFGESSRPATGYETENLAGDIEYFISTTGLGPTSIAGHSAAGAEMTALAVKNPEIVRKLIYLDAAYDWAASVASPPPVQAPTPPPPTTAQLASPEGLAAYVAWLNGLASFPLADIRATALFGCDGRYLGSATPNSIATTFVSQVAAAHPAYPQVTVPVLALYSSMESVQDFFPWLTSDSPQVSKAEAFLPYAQAATKQIRDSFAAALPRATIIELDKVPHFIFLAAPDQVAAAMLTFLTGA